MSDTNQSKPVNILLVDDRNDGLIALEAVLQSRRYNLVSAGSGPEALAMVFDHDFAAIVLDVQMPGMDGFETAKIIRQRERSKRIPILFVTAINKDPSHISKGYELGGVDYIFKPFDPSVLQAKIGVFADLYETHQELLEQSEKLRRSEERNRLLFESANDIIWTCDRDGVITSLSPAFEVMLRLPRLEWIGKPIKDLLHRDDKEPTEKRLSEAARGSTSVPLVGARFRTADGDYRVLEFSPKPLIEKGRVEETLIVARDVTERVRAENEKRQRYELERSNKELEQFAYVCSHDLQEPLRMVVTYAQLLEKKLKDKLNGSESESLKFITDGAKRMSSLVRDILDFSRFGTTSVPQPVETEVAFDEAMGLLKDRIDETGAVIEVGELPPVLGIHSELVRLFQNLLGNAIKFRSSEQPRIKVTSSCTDGELTFSIKDNGIGFDMAFRDQIFQIFKRLHSVSQYSGTGVGLAICKKIVERHGGRIWADSSPNQGTTFSFTLPMNAESSSSAYAS